MAKRNGSEVFQPAAVTARDRAKAHAFIQLRYRVAALRRARHPMRLPTLRCMDLDHLFTDRWGRILPNDDAGRDDARIMAHHIAGCGNRNGRSAEQRIVSWLSLRCPWMDTDEVAYLVMETQRWPVGWKADHLGEILNLTYDDRQRLRITTIRPVDCTFAEMDGLRRKRKVSAKRAKRRTMGIRPREHYERWSLKKTKPWQQLGISRATWYRRETSLTPAKGGNRKKESKEKYGGVRLVSPGGCIEQERKGA